MGKAMTLPKNVKITKQYRDGLAFVEMTKMVPRELKDDANFASLLTVKKPKRRCGGLPSSWFAVKPKHRVNIGRHPMVATAMTLMKYGWMPCGELETADEDRLSYGVIMMADDDVNGTMRACRVLRDGTHRKICI